MIGKGRFPVREGGIGVCRSDAPSRTARRHYPVQPFKQASINANEAKGFGSDKKKEENMNFF
jgi:hypothetical protein